MLKIKIKKLFFILLLFFFFITTNNIYALDNNYTKKEIELKHKIDPILKNILDKRVEEKGEYRGYEDLYNFNKKLYNLDIKNWKIELLKDSIKELMNSYEKKHFINEDTKTIYVRSFLDAPMYVYFNGYKFNIYKTDDNVKTYTYNICEIKNKDKCVKYDKILFLTELKINEIPELKELSIGENLIQEGKDGIYTKHVTGFFPDSLDMVNNGKVGTFQKTKLDYNDKDLRYGKGYDKISDLAIVKYKNTEKKAIGIVKKTKISDVNINKYKNINKMALLEAMSEDSKFLGRKIEQEDLDKLYKKAKELKTIKNIYDYVKKELSYDMSVYNKYIGSGEVDESSNYVFTGIGSLDKHKAVCSGYTSALEYLLAFINVKDIHQQSGFYIDQYSGDLVSHSWLRVGNKYYDITFDDTGDLENVDNRYFGIPKELIMIDRIDVNDNKLYNKISKMNKDERYEYLFKGYLIKSKDKRYKGYKLLKPYQIINKYNIAIKDLNLNNLWKKINNKYKIKIDDNGQIEYLKDYNTGEILNVKSLSLARVDNIEHLFTALRNYNIKDIELAINEKNEFFVILEIVK